MEPNVTPLEWILLSLYIAGLSITITVVVVGMVQMPESDGGVKIYRRLLIGAATFTAISFAALTTAGQTLHP